MVETAAPEHADVVVHQKDANSTSETGSRQNANSSRRLGVVRVAAILGLLVSSQPEWQSTCSSGRTCGPPVPHSSQEAVFCRLPAARLKWPRRAMVRRCSWYTGRAVGTTKG